MTKYDQNMHQIKLKLQSQNQETKKLNDHLKEFENEQIEQKRMYEIKIEELEIMNEEQSNQIKRLNAKYAKKELTPSLSAETAEHGVIAIDDEEDEKKEVDTTSIIPHHSRTRSFGFSHAQSPSSDDEMHKYAIPKNAKHRRSKTKKYKKRNLLKTFSVEDVNFAKLRSGNEDNKSSQHHHQHLLTTRNRALSKTEKIVRRQTVALGAHFEYHLQAQKVKDAKMEKVFDAMEQRKKAKQRKKTLDELHKNEDMNDDNDDELFDIGPGFVFDKSQSLRNVLPPQMMPPLNGSNSLNIGNNVAGIYSQFMRPSLPMQLNLMGSSANLYPWIQSEHQRMSQSAAEVRKSIEKAKLTQIYDNEYKAMKRRYQQKKRKRIAAAMKAGANQINYTEEQSATAVYDSDYIDHELHH